jgi:hypothetical protein
MVHEASQPNFQDGRRPAHAYDDGMQHIRHAQVSGVGVSTAVLGPTLDSLGNRTSNVAASARSAISVNRSFCTCLAAARQYQNLPFILDSYGA